MKRIWFLLLFWFVSLGAADDFSAQLSVSDSELTIYDTLQVNLLLKYPSGFKVDLEALKANLVQETPVQAAPFGLVSADSLDEKEIDGNIENHLQFKLQPEREGTFPITFYSIPLLPSDSTASPVTIISDIKEVHVTMPPKNVSSVFSPNPLLPLSLTLPITINPENRRNIEELFSEDYQTAKNREVFAAHGFPWEAILATVVGLLLLYLVPAMRSIGKKEHIETPEERELRAQQNTLQTIERLRKEQLPPNKFYSSLSNSVRDFIEKKYQVEAEKQTTEELMQVSAAQPELEEEIKKGLGVFFIKADQVKFAHYEPSTIDCEEAFKTVKQFVLHKGADKTRT